MYRKSPFDGIDSGFAAPPYKTSQTPLLTARTPKHLVGGCSDLQNRAKVKERVIRGRIVNTKYDLADVTSLVMPPETPAKANSTNSNDKSSQTANRGWLR
jgi:hypothetical protein